MSYIKEKLNSSELVTKSIINNWECVLPFIINSKHIHTISISPNNANKYIFNLDGYLFYEENIPLKFIYPNIRINGYDSGNQYDGRILRLKIIDPNILELFFEKFTENQDEINDIALL